MRGLILHPHFWDPLVVGRAAVLKPSGQLSGLPGFDATMVVLSAAIIKKDKTLVARSTGLFGKPPVIVVCVLLFFASLAMGIIQNSTTAVFI